MLYPLESSHLHLRQFYIRVENHSPKGYKIIGDANETTLLGKASAITPVPGGVGPMTIAMLIENTIEAAEQFLD